VPSYQITFATPDGPQTTRFTLDDDIPLDVQVPQVVEELRLRGQVIQGASDDELAVFWNGIEVDPRETPRGAGMVVARPIELRMRPRPVQSHTIVAAGYLAKAGYAGVLLGASAATLAWTAGLTLADISSLPISYAALDIALALMFGGAVGAALHGFAAYRRFQPVATAAVLGMMAGALGAGIGAGVALSFREIAGNTPGYGTLLALRMGAWMLVVLGTGISLALLEGRRASPLGLTALVATGSGLFGAIIFNFPGPTALWQGLAFLLCGGALGYALVTWPLRSARALLEVEAVDRKLVGVLAARTTVLTDQLQTPIAAIGRGGRPDRPAAYAWFDGSRVVVTPVDVGAGAPRGTVARVGGLPLERAVLLGDGETVDVGETRWRLHVLGEFA
jgi:hypothetical protein